MLHSIKVENHNKNKFLVLLVGRIYIFEMLQVKEVAFNSEEII